MNLPPDEVHVWLVRPEDATDERLVSTYASLLDPEEAARWRGFRFDRHRHMYLVAHALVRTVLSRYRGGDPRRWTFVRNAHGRPEVVGEEAFLRFNLSHSETMVACAVVRTYDVGVDVENITRSEGTLPMAERYFAPRERAALRALPAARIARRFFEYWTLKEAYVKARGMGLALSLDTFAIELAAGEPIRIAFEAGVDDSGADWQLESLELGTQHVCGLAVRRGRRTNLRLRTWYTIPCSTMHQVADDLEADPIRATSARSTPP